MNKKEEFDLFKLYNSAEDIGPRSQIRVNGENLIFVVNKIIKEIQISGLDIFCLAKLISKELKYHKDTVLKMLKGTNKLISLSVLSELLKKYKVYCKKTEEEISKIKKELQNNITYLSCGSKRTIFCRAVKYMDENLAKIIGAYQADGWMRKEKTKKGYSYKISITDYYKSNLIFFCNYIEKVFSIRPIIFNDKKKKAWTTTVYSKVIGRYIETFFGFSNGDKTLLSMPELIRKAPLELKRAYVCGFLSFEGSVELDRTVSLGIRCENLRDEICKVIKDLDIYFIKSNKNNFYHFRSNSLLKNEINLWMDLFEYNTDKWFKLKDFKEGFSVKATTIENIVKVLENTYGEHIRHKEVFKEIIYQIKDFQCTDRHKLAKILKYSVTSLQSYLKILELSAIIKRKKAGHKLIILFNPNKEDWRVPFRPVI